MSSFRGERIPSAWALALTLGSPQIVSPVPFPGGIAEPDGRMGYVAGPAGRVEAVDLASGRLAWSAAEPGRPLLVVGTRLATEVVLSPNRLRIDVLDTARQGRRVLESHAVVFPDWVSVEDASAFGMEAHAQGNTLRLVWSASARYGGGAPPPRKVAEQARKSQAGEARVDLATGAVEMHPASPTPRPEIPAVLAEVHSHPYQRGGLAKAAPLVVGGVVAALAVQETADRKELVLNRWDLTTGRPEEAIALAAGGQLRPQVTLDGRYVLVEGEAPGAWTAFSVETGRAVASRIPRDPGARELCILGRRLFFSTDGSGSRDVAGLVAQILRAIDLDSGEVLWERPIQGRPSSPARRRP